MVDVIQPCRALLGYTGDFVQFWRMKRIAYHVLFWIIYWGINIYLDFNWVNDNIRGWNDSKKLVRVAFASFLYILPLIILAYYLVFVAIEKIVQKRNTFFVNFLFIVLPYMTAVGLTIVIVRLIVFRYIYEGAIQPGSLFFDPRRVLSIIIEAAFPAVLVLSMKYVDIQVTAKEREKNLVREKLSAELQLLKNQLNPHFLFNTLNNIYALSRKKSDTTPDVILKLSDLLNFMLYEAGADLISVGKEIQFLEDYISLQKIRYTDNLKLSFDREIDNPNQLMAPLLLLPVVENAFKHGASENHFDSFIDIRLQLEGARLRFIVSNSFEPEAEQGKQHNIGLNNTRRQLELLYSEQALELQIRDNIFTATLTINLNSYGEV